MNNPIQILRSFLMELGWRKGLPTAEAARIIREARSAMRRRGVHPTRTIATALQQYAQRKAS